jgi:beta-lactamase superfamily II metal-dependent hydrolase
MKKILWITLKVMLFILACNWQSTAWAQQLKIIHINVGQGDATLFIGPTGKTLLFDAGPSMQGTKLRQIFNNNGLTTLDFFVAGHYHADHIGSIDELLATGITLTTASYDRGSSFTTQSYTDYVNAVGAKRQTIALGQIIDLGGGVTAECVAVDGRTPNGTVSTLDSAGADDENAHSIGLVIRYGTFDYFVASDLTGGGVSGGATKPDVESKIAPYIGDVDVLHVGHHGSRTSTNQLLVNTLKAEQSVVSFASNNTFGHPTQEVIDRLTASAQMINILFTQTSPVGTSAKTRVGGDITFVTNGSTYSITGTTGLNLSYNTDGVTKTGGGGTGGGGTGVGSVVINEIAWSGSATSPNDEWIELYNPTAQAVSLAGWKIVDDNGAQVYNLSGSIPAGGYYLIERAQTATSVTADLIISTLSLANTGDKLQLQDGAGQAIDTVVGGGGAWYAGDNTTAHRTMERVSATVLTDSAANWRANNGVKRNGTDSGGVVINGTPKAKNSVTP